jgi:hypothetical protein
VQDQKHTFYAVKCSNPDCPSLCYGRGGKRNSRKPEGIWLGEIQVDAPNTSKHRCHLCNTVYRHIVSHDGTITREIAKDQTPTQDMIARIEVVAP